MKVLKMGIDGGEPLLREDIFLILQYASEKGIYVNISTNGTLLDKKVVQNLSETKLRYVQVSAHGRDRHMSDRSFCMELHPGLQRGEHEDVLLPS
jgi:MoaA/NifB/PqqE/SkfB family radical SAM enzyme